MSNTLAPLPLPSGDQEVLYRHDQVEDVPRHRFSLSDDPVIRCAQELTLRYAALVTSGRVQGPVLSESKGQ